MGSRWIRNLSCSGARSRVCESAGGQKGRIQGTRTKKKEEPAVGAGVEVGRERREGEKQRKVGGMRFLYPARAAAGPCMRLA